jgi:prepilin peptidase CpaA
MMILLGMYAALLAAAAVQDVLTLRISNGICLALLGVCLAAIAADFDARWWQFFASFLIVLACGISLFAVRWIGAGDAKLFAACALAFTLAGVAKMATLVVIAGGVIALLLISLRLLSSGRDLKTSRHVPYGVAIAIGAVATIFLDPSASLFF